MKNINNQTGRSMIEMLGVLAIIGVLSVGGIAGYSKAMMQYKINKTVDQISQIAGNIRTLFASQKDYKALDNGTGSINYTLIKKAHLVPDEMWNTGQTAIENPFGGSFSIMSAGKKQGVVDWKGFGFYLTSLPEDACMALATYDWGSGTSSGLVAVGINAGSPNSITSTTRFYGGMGNNDEAVAIPGGTVSVPMPVNIAASACKTGDTNSITVNFH